MRFFTQSPTMPRLCIRIGAWLMAPAKRPGAKPLKLPASPGQVTL